MTHYEVLIVGGGNAGISLAARLLCDGVPDVAVVESESVHRYRPLLNYVGAGEASMQSLERPAADVVPDGCTWVQDRVTSVDATAPAVETREHGRIECSTLVLCPGLEEDWDAVDGLRAAYEAGWAGSTFVVETVETVWPALRDLDGTRVVFSVPPEPAPCGATALKPLFMACEHWRGAGLLDALDVHLVLPGARATGHDKADDVIDEALRAYGVHVLRRARVTGLDGRQVTVNADDGEHHLDDVAYAHVVPHYRAPRWIAQSGVAGTTDAGLVDVHPETLRHRRHPAVWALGDVADLGIRPSGGALRKQVAVLAHNIGAVRSDDSNGSNDLERYDGYTVMPITTSRQRLLLVEVDRQGHAVPTVPFLDLARPRRATWWVDRYALPVTYFRRILRGKV